MAEARSITVVMPAHNVARFVAEAVDSVARQSWTDIRLVAIDDGSTDGTGPILEALAKGWATSRRRFDLLRQDRAGAGAARNAGLDRVDGPFVAFLDADDRWHPDLLSRQVSVLDAAPDLDMTFPRYRYVDADGVPIGVETPTPTRMRYDADALMGANPVHSATGVLLRADAVSAAGRFDVSLTGCIDLDLWVRVAALRPGNIGPTDAVLVDYRKRAGQITGDWRRMERNWRRVCDKLAAAGQGLSPRAFRRGRARQCVFWAALAYNAGEYAAARRLIAEAWRRDPAYSASDRMARIRTLAACASLLPEPVHIRLRQRANALRSG